LYVRGRFNGILLDVRHYRLLTVADVTFVDDVAALKVKREKDKKAAKKDAKKKDVRGNDEIT